MKRNLPDTIYLQWHGDDEPSDEPVDTSNVTWSCDRVYKSDVQYRTTKPMKKRLNMKIPRKELKHQIEVLTKQRNHLKKQLDIAFRLLGRYTYIDHASTQQKSS